MPVYISKPREYEAKQRSTWPEDVLEQTEDVDESKFLVGWREWVALPDLGIPGIKAKIDTAAKTSALHTQDYRIIERHGQEWVRFTLHPLPKRPAIECQREARLIEFRRVRASSGGHESRPFVQTTVRLGAFDWPIELGLSTHEHLRFRMHLARSALSGYFLVDPSAVLPHERLSGRRVSVVR